jgi:manganese/zinc/iron transport system substrate-binding protein
LRDYTVRAIASVPEGARALVTAHDAFGYFGRAFDIDLLAIQGISTESEAGLKHIEDLVNTLVGRRIRAVFVETSVSERNVRALIDGAAARGHKVAIGGTLFSDAMGAPGSYRGTYLGMIDHNVTVIARALGGQAPESGLNGRLAVGSN